MSQSVFRPANNRSEHVVIFLSGLIGFVFIYTSAMIVIESSQVEGFTKTIYGRGGYKTKEEDHVRVATARRIQNISI